MAVAFKVGLAVAALLADTFEGLDGVAFLAMVLPMGLVGLDFLRVAVLDLAMLLTSATFLGLLAFWAIALEVARALLPTLMAEADLALGFLAGAFFVPTRTFTSEN